MKNKIDRYIEELTEELFIVEGKSLIYFPEKLNKTLIKSIVRQRVELP